MDNQVIYKNMSFLPPISFITLIHRVLPASIKAFNIWLDKRLFALIMSVFEPNEWQRMNQERNEFGEKILISSK